ncbi:hypothetical protein M422DRAFT_186329 [Sphaerobolus stellatus SS14]|uniref:MULE transposase domain-containing protein n=1 Tax=Sphaerobolus stellatus (strain SS14) TaxID=990650 RepID=A0A0C9V146_SPHS4|nr:hypothetical protein M422DRAFT_186329 [Sphaerobolus stellatus SS14]
MTIEHYPCKGKLLVTVNPKVTDAVRIRIEHHLAHQHYVDISLTEEMKDIIEEMKDSPASMIWTRIVRELPKNEVTQDQVYAYWTSLNEDAWRLDSDQVKSAIAVLSRAEDIDVNIIPTRKEDGISIFAFALKEIIDSFGPQVTEIAMDSTWKTNAAGYELYAVVAEAAGRSLPLAFAFVSTDGTAMKGAKDRALQDVLSWLKIKCPNVAFTLSDKDTSEINAFAAVFEKAKHQLCYWHAIRYLEERLGEDKPPAAYDGRRAHKIHNFIDPTWAPGVTNGHIVEGVSDFTDNNLPDPLPLTQVIFY